MTATGGLVDYVAGRSDRSLQEFADAAVGKPMRLRVSLHLWRPDRANYYPWRGQAWKVRPADSNEALQVVDGLRLFFELANRLGWRALVQALGDWLQEIILSERGASDEPNQLQNPGRVEP